MSGGAGQLHDENRRSWDLASGLVVQGDEIFLLLDLSDTFASSSFGGLDHNWKPDFLGLPKTILRTLTASLGIGFGVDRHDSVLVDGDLVDAGSRPRNTRHLGVLGHNR
ncbi:hypothetical protein OGATHE_001847 [Ogataea polymorpha]|uniref:Uncharacterized protein n=1 Tax=Ogataea polymorpha TaxID=460523 RepID=A0A9P8PL57_9ASCO|nr:hypothetical protein OGATHE_001847 [Ogataea polymorpha]